MGNCSECGGTCQVPAQEVAEVASWAEAAQCIVDLLKAKCSASGRAYDVGDLNRVLRRLQTLIETKAIRLETKCNNVPPTHSTTSANDPFNKAILEVYREAADIGGYCLLLMGKLKREYLDHVHGEELDYLAQNLPDIEAGTRKRGQTNREPTVVGADTWEQLTPREREHLEQVALEDTGQPLRIIGRDKIVFSVGCVDPITGLKKSPEDVVPVEKADV